MTGSFVEDCSVKHMKYFSPEVVTYNWNISISSIFSDIHIKIYIRNMVFTTG
jgi:hypothetical protein